MKSIILALTLILATSLSDFYRFETIESVPPPNDLIVHEWGTFTSIAGNNGVAIDWRPLQEKSDLPKFVYSSVDKNGLRGTYRDRGKGRLAKIRMETAVIYFYTANEMEVDVAVDFPKGEVTEWYPQASKVNARFESGITWGKIKLLPNETPNFLRDAADSHYYPARETDSVPIQVCNADKTKIEKEKFLFYRGIGDFELPLNAKLESDRIVLNYNSAVNLNESDSGRAITNLIIFENRGGKIGYATAPSMAGETKLERPPLNKTLPDVFAELEKSLVLQGLYEKEAKAMIETWKDSWFEEGLRVFYILPRNMTDEILPLRVDPRPQETVRVLVGRAEIITPEMKRDVRKQVGLLRSDSAAIRRTAQKNLQKHGRFYEPILRSILENEKDAQVRTQIQKLIEIS